MKLYEPATVGSVYSLTLKTFASPLSVSKMTSKSEASIGSPSEVRTSKTGVPQPRDVSLLRMPALLHNVSY